MGEAKRTTYTPAFKAKVGLEAIRGVRTVNERRTRGEAVSADEGGVFASIWTTSGFMARVDRSSRGRKPPTA